MGGVKKRQPQAVHLLREERVVKWGGTRMQKDLMSKADLIREGRNSRNGKNSLTGYYRGGSQ